MAYNWQTKTLTFGKGIRDDADDFQLEPPFVAKLRNGVFDKKGTIGKRKGLNEGAAFTTVPTSDPQAVFEVGGRINAASEDGLHVLDGDDWIDAGTLDTVSAKAVATIENRGNAQNIQVVSEGGIVCVGWEDFDLTSNGAVAYTQFFDTEGRPLTEVEQASGGHAFRLLSNSTQGIVTVATFSTGLCISRAAPVGSTTFGSLSTFILTDSPVVSVFTRLRDEVGSVSSGLIDQHTHEPNTLKSTRFRNLQACLNGSDIYVQYVTNAASPSVSANVYEDVVIDKLRPGAGAFPLATARIVLTTESVDLVNNGTELMCLTSKRWQASATQYYYTNLTLIDYDLNVRVQSSLDIAAVTTPAQYIYSSGSIVFTGEKYIAAITETYKGPIDQTSQIDPIVPGIVYKPEYYISTVVYTSNWHLDEKGVTQRIPNTRVTSNFIEKGGKYYIALSEAAHAPRSYFAESDLYLNTWKATNLCSVSNDGLVTPVCPLLPNTCQDYNQMEAARSNCRNFYHEDFVVAREALFPYGIADDSIKTKPADVANPFEDIGEANDPHLFSHLGAGALPRTAIRLHTLAREPILADAYRGAAVVSAGTSYTYDGFSLMETSPLGVPKITSLSATGYVGAFTLSGETAYVGYPPVEVPSEVQFTLDYGDKVGFLVGTGSTAGGVTPEVATVGIAGNSQINPGVIVREDVSGWRSGSRLAYDVFGLQAVVSYTDAQGNVHRSAPSPTVYCSPYLYKYIFGSSIDKSLTYLHTSDLNVTVAVPVSADPSRLTVEIYGNVVESQYATTSEEGATVTTVDSVFQLLGSAPANAYSVGRQNGTTVSCHLSDDDKSTINVYPATVEQEERSWYNFSRDLASGKQLYTESGELPPGVVGNLLYVKRAGKRLFAVPANEPNAVIYSKPSTERNIEFPVAQRVVFPEDATITGLADLDDKLIVFFPDKLYVLYGDGPGILGAGSQYGVQPLPGNVGCSEAKSIVEIPSGVLFKSFSRFYVLDRSLVLHEKNEVRSIISEANIRSSTRNDANGYVVYSLEGNGNEITAAEKGVEAAQTILPAPDSGMHYEPGYAIVYNYIHDAFSVFTNHEFAAMATVNGLLRGVRPDWTFMEEYSGYQDSDVSKFSIMQNKLFIETGWIKLQNMQDYGIVRRVTLLGRHYSAPQGVDPTGGNVRMWLEYNYESGRWPPYYKTWLPTGDINTNDGRQMQISMRPKRNKCQSIKLTVSEESTTTFKEPRLYPTPDQDLSFGNDLPFDPPEPAYPEYAVGRGFEVSAVDIHLGLIGGPKRVAKDRKQ